MPAKKVRYTQSPGDSRGPSGVHFRALRERSKLGGGAEITGAAGLFASAERGYDGENPRPSVLLRMKMHRDSSLCTSGDEDQKEMVRWLNQSLRGFSLVSKADLAQDVREKGNHARELEKKFDTLGEDIDKIQSNPDFMKNEKLSPIDLKNMVSGMNGGLKHLPSGEKLIAGLLGEIAGVLNEGVEAVTGVANTVLGSLPLVGVLASGLKAVSLTVKVVMAQYEKIKNNKIIRSSTSIIEMYALNAANAFLDRKQLLLGMDIGGTLLQGVAAGFGAGPVASLAKGLAEMVAWLTLLIKDLLGVAKANESMTTGKIDLALLARVPALALHLPHLPSASTLTLLGVMPPGWMRCTATQQQEQLLQSALLREPRLEQALRWEEGKGNYLPANTPQGRVQKFQIIGGASNAMVAKVANPWHPEFERLRNMLSQTGEFLQEFRWILVRDDRTPVLPAALQADNMAIKLLKKTFSSDAPKGNTGPPVVPGPDLPPDDEHDYETIELKQ